jgi:hypothetical protein
MAHQQVASGHPHGAAAQWRGPPAVTLVTANGAPMNRRRVPIASSRASGWIVQTVVVATSVFAFLDLYLLVASGHH